MPTPLNPAIPADEQAFLDSAAVHCKARGSSLTPIRRRVLALLRRQPGGLKAYDLLDKIKLDHPSASAPTVYRALEFLIGQGLAHKIGRINQYVACNHDCHDNAGLFLVCPGCSKVTELHDQIALAALSRSLKMIGHALAHPEIEISAVCADCLQANSTTVGTSAVSPAARQVGKGTAQPIISTPNPGVKTI